MEDKDGELVVKSNALVEASYRLTPAEQGIILACIGQIRKDEEVTSQTMYKVSVSSYSGLTKTPTNTAYRDVKQAALRLRNREVRIYNLPNGQGQIKNQQSVLVTGWVQSVIYSDKKGEVELRFNHDMIPYLTNLSKCFTKFNLKTVADMSSGYGIRLYELLSQWRGGEREVSLEYFCKIFMLNDKYSRIYDLKKRVIEPAIEDINKNSDLYVSWAQKKTGKKISHLIFKWKNIKGKEKNTKNYKITRQVIEKHARPGESYNDVKARLSSKNYD
jgi:plasmid replication initiation protein